MYGLCVWVRKEPATGCLEVQYSLASTHCYFFYVLSCPFCLLYVFNKFRARLAVNFFLLIICQVSTFCCCLLLLSFSLNLSWARSVNRIVDFIMQPPNQIAIKRTWTKNLNKPDEKAKTKVKYTKNLSAKQTQIKQNKKKQANKSKIKSQMRPRSKRNKMQHCRRLATLSTFYNTGRQRTHYHQV